MSRKLRNQASHAINPNHFVKLHITTYLYYAMSSNVNGLECHDGSSIGYCSLSGVKQMQRKTRFLWYFTRFALSLQQND